MFVINEIKDKIYDDFIEYAFNHCDTVMFVVRRDIYINSIRIDKNNLDKLEKNMEKYTTDIEDSLINVNHRSSWVSCEVDADDNLFDIYFYKFDNKLKNLLLENKNLFNWLHPLFPEDIAFFKNGSCWMLSSSHERVCEICCDNDKEFEYLNKIGIQFDKKHKLPQYKDFFEKS